MRGSDSSGEDETQRLDEEVGGEHDPAQRAEVLGRMRDDKGADHEGADGGEGGGVGEGLRFGEGGRGETQDYSVAYGV